MTTPAHMAGGYLVARAIGLNEPISLGLAVFFSVLPDIDYFWSKTRHDHHHLIHTPFFWLTVSALLLLISPLFPLLKQLIVPLLSGTMVHLILDFLAAQKSGIKMLFPFSKQEMSFLPLKENASAVKNKYALSWRETKMYYSSNYIFFSEASLLLAALVSFTSPGSGQTALL